MPSKLRLVDQCRADDSDLCRMMTAEPYCLTSDQMLHAADRYRLGKSRSGKTIYWMIDELGICRDGHIGNSWVSQMLKSRYPNLAHYIRPEHCLFGQHLLTEKINGHTEITENADLEYPANRGTALMQGDIKFCDISDFCVTNIPISVVESEKSAVILSEIYPQSLWMAFAYPANLNERLLEPLQGHRIVLFPNADETMDTYLAYLEIADQARRKYHLDITVSTILEDGTTPSQKTRHIDLLDYWVESIRHSATFQSE